MVSSTTVKYSHLRCDACNSYDVVETGEGYVCRNCGIILQIQRFQYDIPFNKSQIQNERGLGKSNLGTKKERALSPNYSKLKRLNKQNSLLKYENGIDKKGKEEITRIISSLNLPYTLKEDFFKRFKEVWLKLNPKTSYRNPEKLSATIIYFCMKLRNLVINEQELIDISILSKQEFNDFKFQIARYIPEYALRKRQEYICQILWEATETLKLGISFYFQAKTILE
ncbi:MAG: hypothetical protein ACXAAH_03335, partial [Promethearchaeota archaeon]